MPAQQRPSLRIEQPPPEWVEQWRREHHPDNGVNKGRSGPIVIDIGGSSSDDHDANGSIVIQM